MRQQSIPCSQMSRWLTVAAIALMNASGCSNGNGPGVTLYAVSGKVTVGGKPAVGARVVLYPQNVEGSANSRLRPSIGLVGEDGVFVVQTFKKGDGAPAGDYAVKIVWPTPQADGQPSVEDPPDLLNGRYADPESSGLSATVAEKETRLPTFDL